MGFTPHLAKVEWLLWFLGLVFLQYLYVVELPESYFVDVQGFAEEGGSVAILAQVAISAHLVSL